MTSKCLLGIVLGFVCILSWQHKVNAVKTRGILFIKFLSYTNPGGKLMNGQCCDGKWLICQWNGCDYKFIICVDEPPLDSNLNHCSIGQRNNSHEIANQDSVVFSSTIGNLQNPLNFTLSQQQLRKGAATLKVKVWDDDVFSKDDFVDYLPLILNLRQHQRKVYRLKSRTQLTISVEIKCSQFLYGPACYVYCRSRDDAGGHYDCHPTTGRKICKKGWMGASCNRSTVIPTGRPRFFPTSPGPTEAAVHGDCNDIARTGDIKSGTFVIKVAGLRPFRVWCDIKNNSGWTLIQRRLDASVNFTRNWNTYRKGFGVLGAKSNYWMGLEKLHYLTKHRKYKLQINIKEIRGASKTSNIQANYGLFWVDAEANRYRLHVGGYSGNAGDALTYHNGQAFSTADRDNDQWRGNCAKFYKSGWWFRRCYRANLNAPFPKYRPGQHYIRSKNVIKWLSERPDAIITGVEMKMTPIS